jgi:hypothetical protein
MCDSAEDSQCCQTGNRWEITKRTGRDAVLSCSQPPSVNSESCNPGPPGRRPGGEQRYDKYHRYDKIYKNCSCTAWQDVHLNSYLSDFFIKKALNRVECGNIEIQFRS